MVPLLSLYQMPLMIQPQNTTCVQEGKPMPPAQPDVYFKDTITSVIISYSPSPFHTSNTHYNCITRVRDPRTGLHSVTLLLFSPPQVPWSLTPQQQRMLVGRSQCLWKHYDSFFLQVFQVVFCFPAEKMVQRSVWQIPKQLRQLIANLNIGQVIQMVG